MNRSLSANLLIRLVTALIFLHLPVPGKAQAGTTPDRNPAIEFPDIPGYRTLKCDFHMHTVLSDGSVWHNIRVQEAIREGLDAIAFTEHLEYQPKKEDIPHPDRNRSHELARQAARGTDLIVISAAEITRPMPPGHFNALFVKDANKLNQEDVMEVFREARSQGAFVFWNHPHWTSQQRNGVATLTDMHRELLAEGLFEGIEIYNESIYSDEALEIALEHNLTLLCNSDVHGLVDWQFNLAEGGHRPVTLVFAEKKSEESIRKALQERRTALWFDNTLVGDARFLKPLVEHSLLVTREGASMVQTLLIENRSDADFILENLSPFTLHNQAGIFILPSHRTTRIEVKTLEVLHPIELTFRVLNAFTAPDEHPEISLRVE